MKNKSFTDIEQSKVLANILPLESADMYYINGSVGKIHIGGWKDEMHDEDDLPCWSLVALRNLLPPAIKPNKDSYLFLFESHNTFDKSWVYRYYNEDDTSYLYYKNTNEIDACYEMIIKLHELNLL